MATVTEVVTEQSSESVETSAKLEVKMIDVTLEQQVWINDKARMPPMTSLFLIYYFLMLCTVNLVITIPTASEYAERLGAGRFFAGLMIGALPIMAIVGNLVNQKLFKCLPFKSIWVVCCLGTVFGSILYALAGLMRFKWTLLISRGLMGLFNAFSLPGIYISHTVGVERRSEVLFYVAAALQLGCAVGPALAAMLESSMKFIKINDLILDSDTLPGWFMAVVYLFFTVKIMLCFKELPAGALNPKEVEGGRTLASPKKHQPIPVTKIMAACAMFWQLFVSSAVTTGVEIYTTNVAQHHLNWSIEKSAWFVAGIMFVAGTFNLSIGRLLRGMACSDIKASLAITCVACLSSVLLFNFEVEQESVQVTLLSLGLTSVLVTNGLLRALAMSICSKLVPAEQVNTIMTWGTISMSLGRGGGSIVCAMLDVDSFAPVLLGLFCSIFLVSYAARKHVKPDVKAS